MRSVKVCRSTAIVALLLGVVKHARLTDKLSHCIIQCVTGREPEFGPTAITVANNIRRLREAGNFTYKQISDQLAVVGWPMTPVAVRRVETRSRRVTVDDLTAFAAVFGVSPASLLMPNITTAGPQDIVTFTGGAAWAERWNQAENVWNWLTARAPLPDIDHEMALNSFAIKSWPAWLRAEAEQRVARIIAQIAAIGSDDPRLADGDG